jgi:hypothetical protein
LNTRNFLPTKLPTRVPAEKVNEIIDLINAMFNADNDFAIGKIVSDNTNVGLEGAPLVNGSLPTDFTVLFEDFTDTASTKAAGNGKFAIAADNTAWFVTEVDSGTGQTETVLGRPVDGGTSAGAQGGWAEFRTCNADNDCLSVQLNGESFKLAYGKKLWFETQLIIEDVSETELFIGLADSGTDLYGAAGVGVQNHVGFMCDGDGNIDCSVDEAATQSKSDTLYDFVDGSIATLATANVKHKLGFYWDGVGTVKFYVDGNLAGSKTDNGATILIPDATCLSPGFAILTQGNTDEAIFIDYIYVAQQR